MTEHDDDIDALAGEYVLGTLPAAERAALAARRQREPDLDAAIRAWEERLHPLTDLVPAAAPPADLFRRIEARLDLSVPGDVTRIEQVEALRRRLRFWQRMTAAACAAAIVVVAAAGLREATRPAAQATYVGVFNEGDRLPSFYLTVDLARRELTIRPVDARRQPGKTYQLWIASETLGPAPRSLGLVDDDLEATRRPLTDFDPALLRRATFGVSLEPAGGSPTGQPTSPALHTRLMPVLQ